MNDEPDAPDARGDDDQREQPAEGASARKQVTVADLIEAEKHGTDDPDVMAELQRVAARMREIRTSIEGADVPRVGTRFRGMPGMSPVSSRGLDTSELARAIEKVRMPAPDLAMERRPSTAEELAPILRELAETSSATLEEQRGLRRAQEETAAEQQRVEARNYRLTVWVLVVTVLSLVVAIGTLILTA